MIPAVLSILLSMLQPSLSSAAVQGPQTDGIAASDSLQRSPPAQADGPRAGTGAGQESPAAVWRQETEYLLLAPGTSEVELAHGFIDPTSFHALVADQPWLLGTDYRLRAREGRWLPARPLGPVGGRSVLVVLRYRFRPVALAAHAELRPVTTGPDTLPAGGEPLPGPPPASAVAPARNLDVRGSKSVRVASGNRRDLTVDQTLRLAIDGQLTRDIAVRASLSDDNLPVVPEGNTEELKDIDRVRVELQAPTWAATMGDFVAEREGTVFGDYRRKLQGATVLARPGPVQVDGLAGSPRGLYRVVELRGEEGNQGPYFLGSGEVGDNLFIVAGSEVVTMDGERLTRGADRDYIVDYVRGTVTFTYRRLVTAESTIVVEFEEGQGPYVRTVVGGGGGASLTLPGGTKGEIGVRLLREKDDPQRLRTGELDDQDRASLAAAGDDQELAVASGVTSLPAGEGHYRTEEVEGRTIYIYDAAAGTYDLTFFYTGPGKGDYGVDSLTVSGMRAYGWRGDGEGSYRVGRPLPLPASHQVTTLSARLGDAEAAGVAAEYDLSELDRNELSSLDDGDNRGEAWVVGARTGRHDLHLGGLALGAVALSGRHESRDSRFSPFLLHKDRFTYDRWGLGQRTARDGFLDERDAETSLDGGWSLGGERRGLAVRGEWGRLSHGDGLSATRSLVSGQYRWLGATGTSTWEAAAATDDVYPLDIQRRHQRHELAWVLGALRPEGFREREEWTDAAATGARAAGFRLDRYGAALGAAPGNLWRWRLGWERGLADSLRVTGWQLQRDARTMRGEIGLPPVAGVRVVGDATWRRVLRPGGPEETTRLGKLDLAGRWPALGSDWSLSYSVDNSRTEVLDRQIIFVGERQGDYDQAGDFVGRDLGDYNVVLAGTDSLVATTEVASDLSWRQDFGFLGRTHWWGAWSSLTHLTVRGRSRTQEVGRLLRLRPSALFDDDQSVLGEVQLRQEADLLRQLRHLDLRLRYDYQQLSDRRFVTEPEDRLRREYEATLTWSPTARTTLRLQGLHQGEERRTEAGATASRRSYLTRTDHQEGEWSFRYRPGDRLALAIEHSTRLDDVSGVRQRERGVRPSLRHRLDKRWSVQADLRWAEVVSEEPPGSLRPFFFAYPGTNIEASLRLDWQPTEQLSVGVVYLGRRPGEREWQHDVRLESTARF